MHIRKLPFNMADFLMSCDLWRNFYYYSASEMQSTAQLEQGIDYNTHVHCT